MAKFTLSEEMKKELVSKKAEYMHNIELYYDTLIQENWGEAMRIATGVVGATWSDELTAEILRACLTETEAVKELVSTYVEKGNAIEDELGDVDVSEYEDIFDDLDI